MYFIAFVLAHSRQKYMVWQDRPFTTKDTILCHEKAFQYYGGVTEEIVYDQDNLIAVSENAGDLILTKEFQQYVKDRKFNIYLCRKADPESKGKIENVVKYVKNNFAKNRVYSTPGEILADHTISLEKGKLIKNANHGRDSSTSLDQLQQQVLTLFPSDQKPIEKPLNLKGNGFYIWV